MSISVVVCAYTMDRWRDLQAAVQSALGQTLSPDEVIVVIDFNDELLSRARRELTGVTVVANVSTKGLSGARNTGIASSFGDIVVFLDDDAYADHDWLEQLTTPFSDPKVAGTGGWVVPHWESTRPAWFPETFYWTLGCSYQGLPDDGATIRNAIGASMAIRRTVFSDVGGFTDGLGRIGRNPLGCEETELSIRLHRKHPDEVFVLRRDAIVHHRVPDSRLTWSYFWRRCWGEGLSKAAVSSLVGADLGLSSERQHVLSALPREVLESVSTIHRRPGESIRRIAWIVGGSVAAATGLLRGRVGLLRTPLRSGSMGEISDLKRFLSGQLTLNLLDESLESEGIDESDSHHTTSVDSQSSPVRLVQLDLDAPPSETPIVDVGERLWVEIIRHDQVVAVLERRVVAPSPPAMFWSDLVYEYEEVETDSIRSVPDDRLPIATVVVPTLYRRRQSLRRTIASLRDMDYPAFEIIVVDNRRLAPEDPIIDFPSEWRVKVVNEPRPGTSAARNLGIAEATGEIVAFTDDDVEVSRHWLRALGNRFALDDEIDAVGGMVRPQALDTRAQLWFEEYYGGFTRFYRPQKWNRRLVSEDDPLFPYTAGKFGASCNIAVRRSTLERLGGFNTSLGGGTPARGGEDLELFVRLLSDGGTVAFEPAAMVRHSHRRSDSEFFRQVFDYGTGLTAMYTCLVLQRPGHLLAIIRRLPAALQHFRRPDGERSVSRAPSYPKKTVLLSLLGMAYGPVAYLRSIARRESTSSSH